MLPLVTKKSLPDSALIFGVPPAFGVLGLLMGKEAGWDFLNYHWYNPYAFLAQRLGFDVAVAHHATFYNPFLDLPFYLVARSLPAWVPGFLLSTVQGLNFSLLFLICRALIPFENEKWRRIVAAGIALAGMGGDGALSLLGMTTNDTVVSLGVLAMVFLVCRYHHEIFQGPPGRAMAWTALAGFLVGISTGLKLTAAIYALGFCLAFFVMAEGRRLLLPAAFGMGAIAGFVLLDGPWMFRLWQYTGNPLFPYFNDFFHSPLLATASYRDARFIPDDFLKCLFFPFYFSFDSSLVDEFYPWDIRILLAYVLIPLGFLLGRCWRKKDFVLLVPAAPSLHLIIGAALSYALWLHLFAIYRYLIVLEMLSPLLIAIALARLPLSFRAWLLITGFFMLISQSFFSVSFDRGDWDNHYVKVDVPATPRPEATMVLMTGFAPMAYVIPSFPPQIPFLRIDGYLVGPESEGAGYNTEMQRRVAGHQGDLYVLFHPQEETGAEEALAAYGLTADLAACQQLKANVGEPLNFCRVARLAKE